jgi:hypothetical protein
MAVGESRVGQVSSPEGDGISIQVEFRSMSTRKSAGPDAGRQGLEFTGKLFRYPGPGGWHFVPVPEGYGPPVTHPWGRTPVEATVDGNSWSTSVWRGKDGRTLLAVPRDVRGAKGDGDLVRVSLRYPTL